MCQALSVIYVAKLRFITPVFDRYFCVVIRSFLTSIATSASMNF